MGRRRVEMKLIENGKARKVVFQKRKNNLFKKAKELSILCDVNVLLMIINQHDKLKPEIWPDNDEQAQEIINTFKIQRLGGNTKRACASKKNNFGEKFDVFEHNMSIINHLSENQLQKLCCELDAQIAAVESAVKSKQVLTETLGNVNQETEFLNKGKEKEQEVVMYQEPVGCRTQVDEEDQGFQMLFNNPNFFMESPITMMMQNGTNYPDQSDGSSGNVTTATGIPYVPYLPIQYVDPPGLQPAYIDPIPWMSYDEPTIYSIPPWMSYNEPTIPQDFHYPIMPPSFPSQMNLSG